MIDIPSNDEQHALALSDASQESVRFQKHYRKHRDRVLERNWKRELAGRDKDDDFIVAVDVEGVTLPNGEHRYVLLGASDGEYVYSEKGLSTRDCFDFLLRYAGKRVVGYAFTYDTDMMLGDLSRWHAVHLHKKGYVYWGNYSVERTARKCLRVGLRIDNKIVKSMTVWDTFGFYQSSFVKACSAWKIGSESEIAHVSSMKERRAEFADVRTEDVAEYNLLECRLLKTLQKELQKCVYGVGLRPSRWDGCGALAGSLMKRHEIKRFMSDDYPGEVMHAYFGGRIQLLMCGNVPGPIYNYDVNSAYPTVIAGLPSLRGKWYHLNRYEPGHDWALWRCRWKLQKDRSISWPDGSETLRRSNHDVFLTPFPFRTEQNRVVYPCQGEGWYWGPLVDLALKWWDIEVCEGYVFEPSNLRERPFSFVADLYNQRQEYKASGDPRHIILKLALNSLYGKTAQGIGWRGSNPPYRNYVWAGLITATTQATLLGAALRNPRGIIGFATDGLYSRAAIDLELGRSLGQWEETVYDSMSIFQPGLARLTREGKSFFRTRGYYPDEVDWERLEAAWYRAESFGQATFKTRRFLTLGVAVQTHNMRNWRRWTESEKTLSLRPSSGQQGEYLGPNLVRWMPDLNVEGQSCSKAFTPRRGRYELEDQVKDAIVLEQPVFVG